MKTEGMPHQLDALAAADGERYFAYLMEQGTGKTWTILAETEGYYGAGRVDALMVLAPKGVHTNWTLREIPTHVSAVCQVATWSSGMSKRRLAMCEALLHAPAGEGRAPLRILAMNYEALLSKDAFAFAVRFLRSGKVILALDESIRIKKHNGALTNAVMKLRQHSFARRIASGAPITNSPMDIFAQWEFLKPGLLGTDSYRAFVTEFAEVLPNDHWMMEQLKKRNPRAAFAQIIAKHEDGTPRYRNLDKLRAMIAKHSFRVLKRDCLKLPEKIYTQRFFDLTPPLRAAYDKLEDELRVQLDDGTIETVAALASLTKLRQITSCHINFQGEIRGLYAAEENPRLQAFLDSIELVEGQFIVWAHFREEIVQIMAALARLKISAVEYHGAVKTKAREEAVDRFQSGDARVFVGQPKAGGIGLTLTAAETTIYYSNDFNMGVRVQSEDRCHRIGTTKHVVYIDLIANDTIDSPIARALQRKTAVAAEILDERQLNLKGIDIGSVKAEDTALDSTPDAAPQARAKAKASEPEWFVGKSAEQAWIDSQEG